MSDTIDIPTDSPKPKASSPTAEQALEHLKKVETHVMQFVGKNTFNPFLWMADKNFAGLRKILSNKKAPATPSTIQEALSIKLEDPWVCEVESHGPLQ